MISFVDMALSIGICLVLLKAVDFILLPSQQTQIQNFFEEFTLWLDDINVEGLAERLNERPIQIILILCVWLIWVVFCGICLSPYLIMDSDMQFVRQVGAHLKSAIFPYFIGVILSLILIIPVWGFGYSHVAIWISHGKTHLNSQLRGVLVVFGNFLFITLLFMIPISVFFNLFSIDFTDQSLVSWIIDLLPWIGIPFNAIFLSGLITTFVGGMMSDIKYGKRSLLVEVFLFFSKSILWRITLFQKGAVGGLVLIMTILLSILKLSLRAQ